MILLHLNFNCVEDDTNVAELADAADSKSVALRHVGSIPTFGIMTDFMEWMLIFFMFYTFLSVWIITGILEKILTVLKEMNSESNVRNYNRD